MTKGKKNQKHEVFGEKILPVPFALGESKENNIIPNCITSKTSKEQIINQAINFHLQGNISEAAKYYQYCLNQGFSDHRVFSNYGTILQGLGKLKEAELSYQKAIELNPKFADAHANLGNILSDLGKLKEAEFFTRKAIELKPDFVNAHANLGDILKDLGKLKEAEISYQKAIELNPKFADAHANLGNILSDQGKLEEAELLTRKAIELNPNLAFAHLNLGNILRDLGKLEEAELSTRKVIELNPNLAFAHLNLGNILRDQGKLKEAELSTCKAIELDPYFPEAHFNLGVVLKDLGKLNEAEVSIIKAIKINPENYIYQYLLGKILIEKKDLKYTSELLEETLIIMTAKKKSFFKEKNNIHTLVLGSSHGEYLFNPSFFKGGFNMCSRSQDLKYSYYLYKKLSPYIENAIIFYSVFSPGLDLDINKEKDVGPAINEIFNLGLSYQNPDMINIYKSIKDNFSDFSISFTKNGFYPKDQFFTPAYGVKKRVNIHMKFNRINYSNEYLIKAILHAKKLNHKIAIVIPPVRSDYKSAIGLKSEILFESLYKIIDKYKIKLINLWNDNTIKDEHFGDYDHLLSNSKSSSYCSKKIYNLFFEKE